MTIKYCDFCGYALKNEPPWYMLKAGTAVTFDVCNLCMDRLKLLVQNKEWKPKDDVDGER